MAAYKSYYEKLKDPRWQKLRLEVMQKAEFRCELCQDGDTTLNVHHSYYEKGLDPWEYNKSTLWCMCEDCHGTTTEEMRTLHQQLGTMHPFDALDIAQRLNHEIHNVNMNRARCITRIIERSGGNIRVKEGLIHIRSNSDIRVRYWNVIKRFRSFFIEHLTTNPPLDAAGSTPAAELGD